MTVRNGALTQQLALTLASTPTLRLPLILLADDGDDVRAAYVKVLTVVARAARAAEMGDPDTVQMMDDALGVLVSRAHANGVSWEAVGEAVGMSASGACRRFSA